MATAVSKVFVRRLPLFGFGIVIDIKSDTPNGKTNLDCTALLPLMASSFRLAMSVDMSRC
jgi:hypothetical protein